MQLSRITRRERICTTFLQAAYGSREHLRAGSPTCFTWLFRVSRGQERCCTDFCKTLPSGFPQCDSSWDPRTHATLKFMGIMSLPPPALKPMRSGTMLSVALVMSHAWKREGPASGKSYGDRGGCLSPTTTVLVPARKRARKTAQSEQREPKTHGVYPTDKDNNPG